MENSQYQQTNAQRIMYVADLPQERSPATYEIGTDKPRIVTVSKRQRQILDLLMQGPVYCASPVRVGDSVFILKREIGLEVHTEMYLGDRSTGSGDYGIYFLKSTVRKLPELEVVA